MPIDTPFVRALVAELNRTAVGARIDKVFMPAPDEVVFALRAPSVKTRLLLSANSRMPRAYFTAESRENPPTPPMFCMLLRKHLAGGKITEIRQPVYDRVIELLVNGYNEMGDPVKKRLVLEITGSTSNLILIDGENRILDAVKHTDITTLNGRPVLPGLEYRYPPVPEKVNPFDTEALHMLLQEDSVDPLDKFLFGRIAGMSPFIGRELAHRLGDRPLHELDAAEAERTLDAFFQAVQRGEVQPVLLRDPEGAPVDLSFTEITHFGNTYQCERFESFSALVEEFFRSRDAAQRRKQRAGDLDKRVRTLIERARKKYENQKQDLKKCRDREPLRIKGELLTAHIAEIPRGAAEVTLENYYDEMRPIRIALDVTKSPQQNAQSYFKKYQKATTAEKMLGAQLTESEQEIEYLETVQESLARVENERDTEEIRAELAAAGYMKKSGKQQKKSKPARGFALFESSDGFVILAGKNNAQNDELTHRVAEKSDLWLHAQNIPGSHVVIICEGEIPPNRTVEEAAIIAATMSKASEAPKVPVQYTQVKTLRKPSGAKPGFVTFTTYQTAFVAPDTALCERLRKK